MKDVCTVNELMRPMMGRPSIIREECAVCGCPGPLNQHHIVKRSAGRLVVGGREVRKPTVTLCGSGNTCGCHGEAHAGKLHFRWVMCTPPFHANGISYDGFGGHWEYLRTNESVDYLTALDMEGWERL